MHIQQKLAPSAKAKNALAMFPDNHRHEGPHTTGLPDHTRSKSGEPLTDEDIRAEIMRRQRPPENCAIKHLPMVGKAKEKVADYFTKNPCEAERQKNLAALNRLLPEDGSVYVGRYALFYGAVAEAFPYTHDRIPHPPLVPGGCSPAEAEKFLYLDDSILESPLHLELTLLHEALGLANNSHAENLDAERDYIYSMVLAQGKYTLSTLGQTVTQFIKEKADKHKIVYLELLQEFFGCATSNQIVQGVCPSLINSTIDAVNVFDRIPDYGRIEVAEISRLEEFHQLRSYRQIAINTILDGHIAFEGFYAGAGSRMGQGPFYSLDPWTVVEELLKDKEGLKQKCPKLVDYAIPKETIRGVGLGPRQLLQLRITLEDLAKQYQPEQGNILSSFVIVLHVNQEVEAKIQQDLLQNQHYGFDPGKVIIVPQPVLPGWYFDAKGKLVLDPRSKLLPYNHGWARMQLNWEGQAHWLDETGKEQPLKKSVIDLLLNRWYVQYLILSRINDLNRLSPKGILDVDLIGLSLYLMQQEHYALTVELVGNDEDEKGGFGLRIGDSTDMFLVESLCGQSASFKKRMEELAEDFRKAHTQGARWKETAKIGVPYNAMRQIEDIKKTKAALDEDLPVVLRYRESLLYLEVLTGDMTTLRGVRARAVMRMHDRFHPDNHNGELINDFKKPEHAFKAVTFLEAQDRQPRFQELAANLIRNDTQMN